MVKIVGARSVENFGPNERGFYSSKAPKMIEPYFVPRLSFDGFQASSSAVCEIFFAPPTHVLQIAFYVIAYEILV